MTSGSVRHAVRTVTLDVALLAQDSVDLLDATGLEPVDLVGHRLSR